MKPTHSPSLPPDRRRTVTRHPATGVQSKRDDADPTGLKAAAQRTLSRRLRAAGLSPAQEYTTGDVARIIGTSRETVRQMILRWEPPNTPGRHPSGLFAFRLGSHRRVPHEDLVDWLCRNTAYLRDIHPDQPE